jgi:hypothetical protein
MKSNPIQRLVREPFVHFVLLGALVFGVDHLMQTRVDDPHLITVTPAANAEMRTVFKSAIGRDPSDADMQVLRQRWIDNEVLYREGLALKVDRGDADIRERVIFKTLSLTQAAMALPAVDDKALRAWFEQHRADYDTPARYDFLEAIMLGDKSEQAVQRFIAALNGGGPDETQSGLRVFKGRPRPSLVTSYGEEFTHALEGLPLNQWTALRSKDGLHVVRLEGRTPGAAADFDRYRNQVKNDWKEATMQAMSRDAVRQMGKKYTVRYANAS